LSIFITITAPVHFAVIFIIFIIDVLPFAVNLDALKFSATSPFNIIIRALVVSVSPLRSVIKFISLFITAIMLSPFIFHVNFVIIIGALLKFTFTVLDPKFSAATHFTNCIFFHVASPFLLTTTILFLMQIISIILILRLFAASKFAIAI